MTQHRLRRLGARLARGVGRRLGRSRGPAARTAPGGRSPGERRPPDDARRADQEHLAAGPARAGAPAGAPVVDYRPYDDERPDPGEVVWAWVPFDEGDGRGKDRPVLVIGRRGPALLGLTLTSRDHDRDAADEARHGRVWMDLGRGAWDARGRPSEVRLDRLLELDPATVRREGAALDRARFDRVVAAARQVQGW
ncbi:type II toxin-antitoxin system PemK/MazF family toxin [Geodermatophilus sp. YIM 151500]|uniref:type II toxin-antitoxin system PemK/MazF family toxin n=1 Tax=Geodermatophilus sp. YIM 151500 TaxID=2984531 RepID=UPI0021E40AC0|nr:type II toxin-antitoxin system PemK/MazF family toxin [Geodermatophilus sp. YIM 151500]MCV2491004.1 type II toxin-antitoxin system PemK/MazF family toxin [Geodermatophilus sp. YIM 151500]